MDNSIENEVKIFVMKVEGKGYNYVRRLKDGKEEFLCDEYFLKAYPFVNGIARVNRKNGMWNYVNESGKIISSSDFTWANEFRKNGVAMVGFSFGINNLINKDGKLLFDNIFEFLEVDPTDEEIYRGFLHGGSFCLLKSDGTIPINEKFSLLDFFGENGVARVLRKNKLYNYIKKDGRFLLDTDYKSASIFRFGFAVVKNDDNLFNIINSSGKFISDEWFLDAEIFSKGKIFWVKRQNGFYNLLDENGDLYFDEEFLELKEFSNYKIIFLKRKNGRWTCIKTGGKLLLENDFASFRGLDNNGTTAIMFDDGTWNYLSCDGKLLLNENLLEASNFEYLGIIGVAKVVKDAGKVSYLRSDGVFISEEEYFELVEKDMKARILKSRNSCKN